MSNTVRDWVTFWDQPHSIYVNARHFDVHYRDIAEGIVALLPGPDARVLDFGCGEALHAGHVAAHCRQLLLCESAARVRMNLEQRFAANANIQVLSPEEMDPAIRGDWALCDVETGAVVETSVTARLLRRYQDELAWHTAALREACRRANITFL